MIFPLNLKTKPLIERQVFWFLAKSVSVKPTNYISLISFFPRITIYIIISYKYSKIYLIALIYYSKGFDRNYDNIPIANIISILVWVAR
jgi:hypothetical protein